MKIKDILYILESISPLDKQEPWDNSGLQLGSLENECKGVLVCLNVDEQTIIQAIEKKANLIISHHPLLFHAINTINTNTIKGSNITTLLKNDITVISMHTNYDATRMNTVILENIGCHSIEAIDDHGILRMGFFKQSLSFENLIDLLKEKFNLEKIRYCGHIPVSIKSITLCAGSGHDYIDEALNHSQIFITGDLTYSHAMDIILKKEGCVIELPHFIEEAFKKDIASHLPVSTYIADEKDYFKMI